MAETFGTVASGLQMVGLAGKPITIGFKLHALYREMQGVSASIAAGLDDIHIVAQILEELNNSPMTAHTVFRTARSHCEKRLRGFSSNFACLNFILHKEDIAKMEHRLKTSLGLLLFAIPLAMLASRERLE